MPDEYAPSSLSTSFCNFCTDLSANSARASACDNKKNRLVIRVMSLSRDLSSILKFLRVYLQNCTSVHALLAIIYKETYYAYIT